MYSSDSNQKRPLCINHKLPWQRAQNDWNVGANIDIDTDFVWHFVFMSTENQRDKKKRSERRSIFIVIHRTELKKKNWTKTLYCSSIVKQDVLWAYIASSCSKLRQSIGLFRVFIVYTQESAFIEQFTHCTSVFFYISVTLEHQNNNNYVNDRYPHINTERGHTVRSIYYIVRMRMRNENTRQLIIKCCRHKESEREKERMRLRHKA